MRDEQEIRERAALAMSRFASLSQLGAGFGYNRASLAWTEEFIEQQRVRRDITQVEIQTLIELIGAYLGEFVIQTYGGNWKPHDGGWGVFFDRNSGAFPFSKVSKQFEGGRGGGDSILGFFDVIPEVFFKKP